MYSRKFISLALDFNIPVCRQPGFKRLHCQKYVLAMLTAATAAVGGSLRLRQCEAPEAEIFSCRRSLAA